MLMGLGCFRLHSFPCLPDGPSDQGPIGWARSPPQDERDLMNPSRRSIREPQSVAHLSRTFSRSLSAVDLAEPLASLDENQPVELARDLLQSRQLSVIGIRRSGSVAGWVTPDNLDAETLGSSRQDFRPEQVLPEGASISAVLGALAQTENVFIEWLGEIAGVITRRDLQKPPLRMWLFGAITVLDTNLTWAVEELYPADGWQDFVTPGRLEKAVSLRAERERRGSPCRLVDCLQLKDKADLLVKDSASLSLLGGISRREADRLTRDIEKLRNHLAHSQELESEHLDTATRLATSIDSILGAELAQRLVNSRGDSSPAPLP